MHFNKLNYYLLLIFILCNLEEFSKYNIKSNRGVENLQHLSYTLQTIQEHSTSSLIMVIL